VRRLSVASLDSGAESPVYGKKPSASADHVGPKAVPPSADGVRCAITGTLGHRTVTARLPGETCSGVPRYADNVGLVVSAGHASLPALPVATLPGAQSMSSGQATPGRYPATSDVTRTVARTLPLQVGVGVVRLATTYDMSVVDPQSGRWYVKDIRASTQSVGNPMTRCASSWAVPHGPRSPRTLTDVHGREG
jgi:hypothetical protein